MLERLAQQYLGSLTPGQIREGLGRWLVSLDAAQWQAVEEVAAQERERRRQQDVAGQLLNFTRNGPQRPGGHQ